MKKIIYAAAVALSLLACRKSELIQHDQNVLPENFELNQILDLPATTAEYRRVLPKYLQVAGLVVRPVSDEKATIGRVLFYDRNLSKDGTTSCASCHNPKRAFSDTEAFSTGIFGLKTARNSMPIANVASFSAHYNPFDADGPRLLWDNRAATVAEQAPMAFLNNHEMGLTMEEVVARVQEAPYYSPLWKDAYGHFDVAKDQLLECLTQFVGAMGGTNSKFDMAVEQVNGNMNFQQSVIIIQQIYSGHNDTITLGLPGFSSSENRGRNLFIDNCSKCHSPIKPFQEVTEACNGLELEYRDQGKGKLTGNPADNGIFKAPSLRNIELTAPYMHDGRFKTLEDVVDFYSTGVTNHPNLHPALKPNGTVVRNFTYEQKSDLVAFLKTLTDVTVAVDARFSDPFWH